MDGFQLCVIAFTTMAVIFVIMLLLELKFYIEGEIELWQLRKIYTDDELEELGYLD